jgi:hypothetical protein
MTNTFIEAIEAEGQTLIVAGESAWAEAKSELETLGQEVLSVLSGAITYAINGAQSGDTIEQIETMVLNLLEQEAAALVKSLSSGLLQTLIAFAKSAL